MTIPGPSSDKIQVQELKVFFNGKRHQWLKPLMFVKHQILGYRCRLVLCTTFWIYFGFILVLCHIYNITTSLHNSVVHFTYFNCQWHGLLKLSNHGWGQYSDDWPSQVVIHGKPTVPKIKIEAPMAPELVVSSMRECDGWHQKWNQRQP